MIERKKHLYAVLFRFGPDGLSGIHSQELERVVDSDNGEVITERELPPVPVTLQEALALVGPAPTVPATTSKKGAKNGS